MGKEKVKEVVPDDVPVFDSMEMIEKELTAKLGLLDLGKLGEPLARNCYNFETVPEKRHLLPWRKLLFRDRVGSCAGILLGVGSVEIFGDEFRRGRQAGQGGLDRSLLFDERCVKDGNGSFIRNDAPEFVEIPIVEARRILFAAELCVENLIRRKDFLDRPMEQSAHCGGPISYDCRARKIFDRGGLTELQKLSLADSVMVCRRESARLHRQIERMRERRQIELSQPYRDEYWQKQATKKQAAQAVKSESDMAGLARMVAVLIREGKV